MASKWIKLRPGIRYREHPTRKHGIKPDRYYTIFYKLDGRMVEESLGWGSKGMTEKKAVSTLSELQENQRRGDGPRTLKEKKELQRIASEKLDKENLTVSEFWKEDYLHNLETRIKPSSFIKEKQHFTKRIEPAIGKKPLVVVTAVDIEKIRDKMISDGFAPRTVQYMVGTFFRIWKHAARRKLVKAGDNPAAEISIKQVNNARTRVIAPDELESILNKVKDLSIEAYRITIFCAFTGCRFSEAARLQWENVDLRNNTAFFPDTKNRESRQVYLSETVKNMLETIPDKDTGSSVFLTRKGKPYIEPPSPFRTAVNSLKLNEGRTGRDRISFHSLRHTAATYAARNGATLKDLQDMFGWKVPSMVFRYSKGDQEAQRKAVNTLERSLKTKPKNAKVIDLNAKRGK